MCTKIQDVSGTPDINSSNMSVYRYSVWFVKGLREFTKKAFAAAQKSFKADALDVDMSDRSFMITGANSGIGMATALALAESSGNDKVLLHILDMSQPASICQFARDFVSSGKPLHVLVNNAGCMVNSREETSDGYEANFATNTLGTFILTKELIPCLSKQDSSRVIQVSSGVKLKIVF